LQSEVRVIEEVRQTNADVVEKLFGIDAAVVDLKRGLEEQAAAAAAAAALQQQLLLQQDNTPARRAELRQELEAVAAAITAQVLMKNSAAGSLVPVFGLPLGSAAAALPPSEIASWSIPASATVSSNGQSQPTPGGVARAPIEVSAGQRAMDDLLYLRKHSRGGVRIVIGAAGTVDRWGSKISRNSLASLQHSCLRIVLAYAGLGKTWLLKSIASRHATPSSEATPVATNPPPAVEQVKLTAAAAPAAQAKMAAGKAAVTVPAARAAVHGAATKPAPKAGPSARTPATSAGAAATKSAPKAAVAASRTTAGPALSGVATKSAAATPVSAVPVAPAAPASSLVSDGDDSEPPSSMLRSAELRGKFGRVLLIRLRDLNVEAADWASCETVGEVVAQLVSGIYGVDVARFPRSTVAEAIFSPPATAAPKDTLWLLDGFDELPGASTLLSEGLVRDAATAFKAMTEKAAAPVERGHRARPAKPLLLSGTPADRLAAVMRVLLTQVRACGVSRP
jgi:hypothetical protein